MKGGNSGQNAVVEGNTPPARRLVPEHIWRLIKGTQV